MTRDEIIANHAAHVLSAIDDLKTCLGDASPEALVREQFRRFAVERSFESLCAALRLLPNSLKARQQKVDWKAIADLDDRLHNQYYLNSIDELCEIAAKYLAPLKAFAERVVRSQ